MTTEILLETIVDLEAKVNELEYRLQNAEDKLITVSAKYRNLVASLKFIVANTLGDKHEQ